MGGVLGKKPKWRNPSGKTYIDHTVEITSLETPPKNPSLIFPCINDLAPSYCSSISNTWKAKQFQFFLLHHYFFFFLNLSRQSLKTETLSCHESVCFIVFPFALSRCTSAILFLNSIYELPAR